MLHSLKGRIAKIGDNFVVLEWNGVGFKILTNSETLRRLPKSSEEIIFFCFLYMRDEALELYGFLEEEALGLFELLNTVAGVGPKTALAILDVDGVENIMAAIIEKRFELLTRTSGIGRKTAERIILELHSKIKLPGAKTLTETMDLNLEIEEALVGLGYGRGQVKRALNEVSPEIKNLEERLRATLKILSQRK